MKRQKSLSTLDAGIFSGIILFTLADNKVSPNFDSRGYIMISGALLADAVIGNVQEKNMKKYGGSSNEMVSFFSNFFPEIINSKFTFLHKLFSGPLFILDRSRLHFLPNNCHRRNFRCRPILFPSKFPSNLYFSSNCNSAHDEDIRLCSDFRTTRVFGGERRSDDG